MLAGKDAGGAVPFEKGEIKAVLTPWDCREGSNWEQSWLNEGLGGMSAKLKCGDREMEAEVRLMQTPVPCMCWRQLARLV